LEVTVQEIKRTTLETILKSFNATSKDETRLMLNGVNLSNNDDGLLSIQATDGHILVKHDTQDKIELSESITIDRIGSAKLKNFLTANKDLKFLIDINVEQNNNLQLFTLQKRDGVILPVIQREYVKTGTIISGAVNKKDYIEINFNPVLLEKLYKTMKKTKDRNPRVTFKIDKNSSLSPIVVGCHASDVLGLLMPLKV